MIVSIGYQKEERRFSVCACDQSKTCWIEQTHYREEYKHQNVENFHPMGGSESVVERAAGFF